MTYLLKSYLTPLHQPACHPASPPPCLSVCPLSGPQAPWPTYTATI